MLDIPKGTDLTELKRKVQREYEQGYNHIKNEIERKRDILSKLIPINVPEGQVRINLLWKNIQLERALFVSDRLNVHYLADDSVIGKRIMRNSEMMAQYDDMTMLLDEVREDIVDYNALYGLAITTIDGYDEEESQPIVACVNPLTAIPDPKNWRGSRMRWIGFARRVSKDFLLNNKGFIENNVKQLEAEETDNVLNLVEESENTANDTNQIFEQEGLVDIYDHYTIWKGHKVLTTWGDNRTKLIRFEEIEPLSNAEKQNPSKVRFPVQLHRRKNRPGSFFGVSQADEILQFQDAVTLLTNLQLIQARQSALGPDLFFDNSLGIDVNTLAQKMPGGRVIPVMNLNQNGANVGNSFFNSQPVNPSQFPNYMIGQMKAEVKENTGAGDVAFGNSPQGSQTKAEIQTLMANTNQLLSDVGDNYLKGQREYWIAHYRCYALNMDKNDKKSVTLWRDNRMEYASLRRSDFIADGKINVVVESQNQIDKENEKNSAKLMALQGVYLPYITGAYARNQFLRKIGECQGIKGFNSDEYIEKTADELIAESNLELLNRDIEVGGPQAGQDYRTYLAIYNQAVDTSAKRKVVFAYEQAIIAENTMRLAGSPEGVGQQATGGDEQVKNIAMNQLSQQQGPNTPNIQQVAQ